MASQFSSEMMENLTPLVSEIIGLGGFDASVHLVERFGGARIPLSKGLHECGEKYINEDVGDEYMSPAVLQRSVKSAIASFWLTMIECATKDVRSTIPFWRCTPLRYKLHYRA
ncbi:hypothetical protein ACXEHT_004883 [Klebsiella variicola]